LSGAWNEILPSTLSIGMSPVPMALGQPVNAAYDRRNIPALTGLRGLAAIWVVLFHLTLGIPIIRHGYLGVDVFFMLSGYVLTHVYAGKLANAADYFGFIRARLARIYPLHLTTLCVLALMVVALPDFADRYPMQEERWGFTPFLASLFLVQNWAHVLPTSWNTPAWSLSAEWFAYLIFPLFLFATQWPRSVIVPLFLAGSVLFVLYGAFTLKGLPGLGGEGTPGMLRMTCEFAAGCMLARAVANGLRPLPPVADIVALALVLIAAILGGTFTYLVLPGFVLFVLLAVQESPTARVLSRAPIVFLGEISYSIYLIHWILIQVSRWFLADRLAGTPWQAMWNIGLVLVCIGISTLTYRWIERPARAWGRSSRTQAEKTLATI
jgi:peptidoglycan/LPS O-acetylase OafA/YrhL